MIVIAGQGSAILDETGALQSEFSGFDTRRMPLYVKMGLLASLRAIAKLTLPKETGLVIGSGFGCQKMSADFMDSVSSDGLALASPMPFSHSVNNVAAALIGKALGITGPAFTINNQERSLEGALQTGISLLEAGRCPACLVGIAEETDERLADLIPVPKIPSSFFLFLQNVNPRCYS